MFDFGKSRLVVTVAVAGSLLAATVAPVMAGQGKVTPVDKSRLDAAQAEYTQYRRGWRGGNRGAAIAGAVGLGILGAAAIAANRRAYAEPVYEYEPEYYERPTYYRQPRSSYGYYPHLYGDMQFYESGRDPAGGR